MGHLKYKKYTKNTRVKICNICGKFCSQKKKLSLILNFENNKKKMEKFGFHLHKKTHQFVNFVYRNILWLFATLCSVHKMVEKFKK